MVARSHQLASHCHTLRVASPDHNVFQRITGHFTGPAVDHRTVADRGVRSGRQVNHHSARRAYTHRHMGTLCIAKDHVAGQSMGLITRGTSGGFEYAGNCPRPCRRRAAAQGNYTDCQEDKWPSLHSSFRQH